MTTVSASPVVQWTDRTAWDRLVRSSPTGSVFCRSEFLDALDVGWEVVRLEGGDLPRAAALVFRDEAGRIQPAPLPFSLYQGVVLDPTLSTMPDHRRVPETMSAVTALLAGMEEQGMISLCLHPRFPDARPFSWFHYHEPALGRFRVDLRYTGLIAVDPARGLEPVLARARSVRRQEYRKAAARFAVEATADLDLLDRLHELTFARQGIARPERERRLLRSIAERALAQDFGELLVAVDESGRPAAATLFLFDDRTGYYLVAANDPDFRSAGTSTLMFAAGVERCLARGVSTIDVVGMNSPSRGDFKASFGAVPVPYLVASWERP